MNARGGTAAGGYPVDTGAFAALALVLVAVVAPRVVGFTADSDAYLDVAANLRAGRGLVQSVVDFWRPGVPDPLGMWPPLYPALVALVAACGVPLELAARLVAGAGFVAFAAAFHALAARALGRGLGALVALFAIALPGVALLGAQAWSESTYLALVTAALALLAGSAGGAPIGRGRAVAAGLALALAALDRHGGMAVALAAVVAAARTPTLRGARLGFALAALALPAAWLARNLFVFGRPFGPALPAAHFGVAQQASVMARALRWELLPAPFDAGGVSSIALVGVLALGALLALRAGGIGRVAVGLGALHLAVVLAAVSLSAINAPTGRYLAPALPFLALGAIAGLAGPRALGSRRVLATGFAGMLALAGGIEFIGWIGAHAPSPPDALERRRDHAALARLVPPGITPVLSDCGHTLRLATGRAAVQVPPAGFRVRDYSAADDARWADAGVHEAVMVGAAPPPAGAWSAAGTAGRFTLWKRSATP